MHRPGFRRSIPRILAVTSLAAGSLFASAAAAAPTYSVKILGTFRTDGTGTSCAGGINDAGVVVGGANDGSNLAVFRWRASTSMSNRGRIVPPYDSYGLSINSAETLCGFGI